MKNVLWVVALLVAAFVVNAVVTHDRVAGAMTPLEAQSMDMTTMHAPASAFMVSLTNPVPAAGGTVETFPGQVEASSASTITARAAGVLDTLTAYPGDTVTEGQVLGHISAPELGDAARAARGVGAASENAIAAAEANVTAATGAVAQAEATLQSAMAARDKSQAGLEVAQGQISLDAAKLASEMSRLASAHAATVYAQQSADRANALVKKGYISVDQDQLALRNLAEARAKEDMVKARIAVAQQNSVIDHSRIKAAEAGLRGSDSEIQSDKAALQNAKAGVVRAQAEVDQARSQMAESTSIYAGAAQLAGYQSVVAPIAGKVGERLAPPGSVVVVGQPILTLLAEGSVRIQVHLPQALLSKVRVGTPTVVDEQGTKTATRFTAVFPLVDSQTRTFVAEAQVPNPGGKLLPGQFVNVSVALGGSGAAVEVPSSSILTDGGGHPYVWMAQVIPGTGKTDWTCTMHPQVSEKGPGKCPVCGMPLVPRTKTGNLKVVPQTVVVVGTDGPNTIVKSGLDTDDRVVTEGGSELFPNAPIEVGKG